MFAIWWTSFLLIRPSWWRITSVCIASFLYYQLVCFICFVLTLFVSPVSLYDQFVSTDNLGCIHPSHNTPHPLLSLSLSHSPLFNSVLPTMGYCGTQKLKSTLLRTRDDNAPALKFACIGHWQEFLPCSKLHLPGPFSDSIIDRFYTALFSALELIQCALTAVACWTGVK